MKVLHDQQFATKVGSFFGQYVGTFTSTHQQIRADLFHEQGSLVAHISFFKGYNPHTVTDKYLSELNSYANEHGYAGRLRIIFAES